MFLSFSSFPPDSALRVPGSGLSSSVPLSTTQEVSVFQGPSVVKNVGNVKRNFHEVIGGMRCGPARRWVQAQLAVRKAVGKRWLRVFNGKRELRDVHAEEVKDWEVDQFADALVLRSSRAVPRVWRLREWRQTDEINNDCFSFLGSWSFQTGTPHRIHTQLYGTMCSILKSIHQVRAPPVQLAELEVPL